MSWNKQTSTNEVRQHWTRLVSTPIRISTLDEDLDRASLSEFQCKRVFGAHVYVSLPASAPPASRVYDLEGPERYQELTRAIHLYQREVFRIVGLFDGYIVHFQGSKLHAVLYKPFGNGSAIATRAILLQLVLNDFVHHVFHQVFPHYQMLTTASGADLGTTIVTANGQRNDREILFLGSAANYAAKIIVLEDEAPRMTQNLYEALPKKIKELCLPVQRKELVASEIYHLPLRGTKTLEYLLNSYGISWEPESSLRILMQDKQALYLKSIHHRSEHDLIDLDDLSIWNNRRVLAASLFADISGFTRYIQSHEHTQSQVLAIRILHVMRREMSRVVSDDYDGLRIQFQGDRVQALFHLPKGDRRTIALQAVEAAIGLQSSMENVLKAIVPDQAANLYLAIGIDLGATLVSKLGIRARRDLICLGRAVERASELEDNCGGKQIAISSRVHQSLPLPLRRYFKLDRKTQGYVATNLTFDRIEDVFLERKA